MLFKRFTKKFINDTDSQHIGWKNDKKTEIKDRIPPQSNLSKYIYIGLSKRISIIKKKLKVNKIQIRSNPFTL